LGKLQQTQDLDSNLQNGLEKRTHRLRLSPRSALQKCIRTNGLPLLKLAGVSVDARQQETRKLTRCGFPFWSFSPSGIAVGLQPEAPTRGFEPNCGACFGQRLPSSVIPQKPHAASTRPRHHGKGHMQSVSMCGQKRFSLSLHAVPANDSTRQPSHWLNFSPPKFCLSSSPSSTQHRPLGASPLSSPVSKGQFTAFPCSSKTHGPGKPAKAANQS
jgi:hypothetical protein